jgi:hypothetical protein
MTDDGRAHCHYDGCQRQHHMWPTEEHGDEPGLKQRHLDS